MSCSCDLIRDLLPLYCDEICSEDSANAVREHICGCKSCSDIYEKMRQAEAQGGAEAAMEYERRQADSLRKIKRKIRRRNTVWGTIGLLIGIWLAVLVLRILLMAGVLAFAAREGEKSSSTTGVSEYGAFEGFKGYSKLDIFPERITGDMEEVSYFYYYADTFLDPTAQIYLECIYDGDSYAEEINRLQGIREEYRGKAQAIEYDTESFAYPAYVAINANNHCYEYALLLGERRIAYLFLQFIGEEEIVFPKEYLPQNYESGKEGFSIYLFKHEKRNEWHSVY